MVGEGGGMDWSGYKRKKSYSWDYSEWGSWEGGWCCGDDWRVEVSPPIRLIIEGKSAEGKGRNEVL